MCIYSDAKVNFVPFGNFGIRFFFFFFLIIMAYLIIRSKIVNLNNRIINVKRQGNQVLVITFVL